MQNVTPSTEPLSEDLIAKLNQSITARLLKHKGDIPSSLFQQILGDETLLDEIYISIRKRIDAISKLIFGTAVVNRKRSAKEALVATGRALYLTHSVVAEMPNGKTEIAEVFLFNPGRAVSNAELDKEYELRGLKPADPYLLAALNEADPAFADTKPNATQWKNAKGKYCFAAFNRTSDDGRFVSVRQEDLGWAGDWWFVGVCK